MSNTLRMLVENWHLYLCQSMAALYLVYNSLVFCTVLSVLLNQLSILAPVEALEVAD